MKVNVFFFGGMLLLLGWVHGCKDTDDTPQIENPDPDSTLNLVNAFPNLSFERPVDFQSPDDGTNRIFVVQQRGVIKVFPNDADVTEAVTFLDISDKILTGAGEQGLLGLAFHPNFSSNGYFYINYNPDVSRTRICRFQVSASDADQADLASEMLIMEFQQPFNNHNGGQLAFGPDGMLYISSGDGGSGGDPDGHAQNLTNLLGAILRIDVDNPPNGLAYGIPIDNPFTGQTAARGEIYAYGLRNPWRMSFDTHDGTLWVGDVGQNDYEEIDIIKKGANYGWNVLEGNHCYNAGSCEREGFEAPIFEYPQSDRNQSVTGGYVYRGTTVEQLRGKYVYGDFVSGRIWTLETDGSANTEIMDTNLGIASFGTDTQNELYICAFDGKIYKFVTE